MKLKKIISTLLITTLIVSSVIVPKTVKAENTTYEMKQNVPLNFSIQRTSNDPNEEPYVYIKLRAEKTGLLRISSSLDSQVYCLLDSNMKPISEEVWYFKDVYYAVKKNKIYYIRYKTCGFLKDLINTQLKYTITSYKNFCTTTKKKAKLAKNNKWKQTFMQQNNKPVWFKIKVKKDRFISFRIKAKYCTGDYKITLYKGKKKVASQNFGYSDLGITSDFKKNGEYNTYSMHYNRDKTQTYYVKIQPKNKLSHGLLKFKTVAYKSRY